MHERIKRRWEEEMGRRKGGGEGEGRCRGREGMTVKFSQNQQRAFLCCFWPRAEGEWSQSVYPENKRCPLSSRTWCFMQVEPQMLTNQRLGQWVQWGCQLQKPRPPPCGSCCAVHSAGQNIDLCIFYVRAVAYSVGIIRTLQQGLAAQTASLASHWLT